MQPFERLRLVRKKINISQSEFAESLGIKQGSYSDIERGKTKGISDSLLKLISNIYNVNIDYILTGEGEMLKDAIKNNSILNVGDGNISNMGSGSASGSINSNSNQQLLNRIQELEKQIEFLERTITDKDKIIADKDKIIALYEKMLP